MTEDVNKWIGGRILISPGNLARLLTQHGVSQSRYSSFLLIGCCLTLTIGHVSCAKYKKFPFGFCSSWRKEVYLLCSVWTKYLWILIGLFWILLYYCDITVLYCQCSPRRLLCCVVTVFYQDCGLDFVFADAAISFAFCCHFCHDDCTLFRW